MRTAVASREEVALEQLFVPKWMNDKFERHLMYAAYEQVQKLGVTSLEQMLACTFRLHHTHVGIAPGGGALFAFPPNFGDGQLATIFAELERFKIPLPAIEYSATTKRRWNSAIGHFY